jgi:hypothetical protein
MTTTLNKAPMMHNNIQRSASRIWKKSYLNKVVKECKAAGYDCIIDNDSIRIGLKETNQVFLTAIRGNGGWLTRYDQKLFDENYNG